MNTVTVKINGVEYNLKGKENEQYLLQVAKYVDGKIRDISSNNSKLSTTAVAVLSALNIADEFFKAEEEILEYNKRKSTLEERYLALKERLREVKVEVEDNNKVKNSEIDRLKNIICSMEEKIKEVDSLYNTINNLHKELDDTKKNYEDQIEKVKEEAKNENDELINAYAMEKEQLMSDFSTEKEELISSFSIEKEELISKFSMEKEQLISGFSAEKESLISYSALEKDKLNEEYSNKIKDLTISFGSEREELNTRIRSKESELSLLNEKYEELKNINEGLAADKNSLADKITLKEKEIEEAKTNSDEINALRDRLKDIINEKELLKNNNKELKFKLQNSRYKVLDLEKKLNDANFSLAVEKKAKNPLLK